LAHPPEADKSLCWCRVSYPRSAASGGPAAYDPQWDLNRREFPLCGKTRLRRYFTGSIPVAIKIEAGQIFAIGLSAGPCRCFSLAEFDDIAFAQIGIFRAFFSALILDTLICFLYISLLIPKTYTVYETDILLK